MEQSPHAANIPKARLDLDFMPIEHQGRQMVLVQDRLGLVAQGTALPVWVYHLLTILDGTRVTRDIQHQLSRLRQGGQVSPQEVGQLLDELDSLHLLDTPGYRQTRQELINAFSRSPVRPAVLSGRSYPEARDDLSGLLDGILASKTGTVSQPSNRSVGLVAPHIDLDIGRRTYGTAYSAIQGQRFDRIVVLGIGHQLTDGCYSLTSKTFTTPLGQLAADAQAVTMLREHGSGCLSPDDFAHRDEHSAEFQVLFLQHLLGREKPILVPILCGSLLGSLPEYSREAFLDMTGEFLDALRALITEPDKSTLIVAGVDLSHIGPKFGHDLEAAGLETQAVAHDTELLERLVAGDAPGFWQESKRHHDRFNVCGFSALATMLEILPPCTGRILDYQMWHEAPTRSAVSFAAAVFD